MQQGESVPLRKVSGIPEIFWKTLYKKLTNQTFDAGCVFSLLLIDYGEEDREEADPAWTVIVSKPDGIDHKNGSEIDLIDHAWTFRNEQVTRDFIDGVALSGKERSALLLPWKPANFKSEDYKQNEPEETYFSEGHIPESIPEGCFEEPFVDTNRPLRVYSEYDVIREFLTDPAFELVNYEHEADILGLMKQYKKHCGVKSGIA